MKRHVSMVHEKLKRHKCDICPSSFYHKLDLTKHKSTVHDKIKQCKCDTCSLAFTSVNNLSRHIVAIHTAKENNVKCDICAHEFPQDSYLKRHKAWVHGSIKNHKCDFCDKPFFVYSELKKHLRVHDRPKDFKYKSTIKKNFKCEQCSSSYDRSIHLINHRVSVHGGDTSYNCDICDLAFAKDFWLKKHFIKK